MEATRKQQKIYAAKIMMNPLIQLHSGIGVYLTILSFIYFLNRSFC